MMFTQADLAALTSEQLCLVDGRNPALIIAAMFSSVSHVLAQYPELMGPTAQFMRKLADTYDEERSRTDTTH